MSKTINKRSYNSYGLAQKLINMTFKYFYIYKDFIDKNIDFSKCECPIDSIILNRLGREEKWTNITFDEYEGIKKNIRECLKEKKYSDRLKEIGELAFDDNWVNT